MVRSVRRANKLAPSIADVAKLAGVSSATVDRVLNDRGGVSQTKARQVQEALDKLQSMQSSRTETVSELSFGMVIDSGSSFTSTLKQLVEESNKDDPNTIIHVHTSLTNQFDAGAFSDKILEWGVKFDGIVVVSREHPAISRAIEAVADQGKGIVCLTTDQQNTRRLQYAGMDQVASGLCAAHLIGRYGKRTTGSVMLMVSAPYRCQEERELGFRRLLRSDYPDLSVIELLNATDNSESSYRILHEMLETNPPPVAVYNMAGGNAGIARALREHGVHEDVLFVGHELNDTSRHLLEQGAMDFVITHDLQKELDRAKTALREHYSSEPLSQQPPLLQPVIKCKFNI